MSRCVAAPSEEQHRLDFLLCPESHAGPPVTTNLAGYCSFPVTGPFTEWRHFGAVADTAHQLMTNRGTPVRCDRSPEAKSRQS